MIKAIGIRQRLAKGMVAEVYYNGTIILKLGDAQEFYNSQGQLEATNNGKQELWADLGMPLNLHQYVHLHGRPFGTLWREK
jgi:hypothetical protein